MIYSDKTNVFGQDVDLNGHLRPSALLAKMEDAGSRQMAAFPPSNDDLRARPVKAFEQLFLEFAPILPRGNDGCRRDPRRCRALKRVSAGLVRYHADDMSRLYYPAFLGIDQRLKIRAAA